MDWTKTAPDSPGWYWWRQPKENYSVEVALVGDCEDGGGLWVERMGNTVSPMCDVMLEDGEWSGPLTPPADSACPECGGSGETGGDAWDADVYPVPCPSCQPSADSGESSGDPLTDLRENRYAPEPCATCGGLGKVQRGSAEGHVGTWLALCPDCEGEGTINRYGDETQFGCAPGSGDEPCATCGGSGTIVCHEKGGNAAWCAPCPNCGSADSGEAGFVCPHCGSTHWGEIDDHGEIFRFCRDCLCGHPHGKTPTSQPRRVCGYCDQRPRPHKFNHTWYCIHAPTRNIGKDDYGNPKMRPCAFSTDPACDAFRAKGKTCGDCAATDEDGPEIEGCRANSGDVIDSADAACDAFRDAAGGEDRRPYTKPGPADNMGAEALRRDLEALAADLAALGEGIGATISNEIKNRQSCYDIVLERMNGAGGLADRIKENKADLAALESQLASLACRSCADYMLDSTRCNDRSLPRYECWTSRTEALAERVDALHGDQSQIYENQANQSDRLDALEAELRKEKDSTSDNLEALDKRLRELAGIVANVCGFVVEHEVQAWVDTADEDAAKRIAEGDDG